MCRLGPGLRFGPGAADKAATPPKGRTVRSLNLNLGRLRHSGYYMMAGSLRGPGQAAQVEVPLGHCRSSLTRRLTLDGAPQWLCKLTEAATMRTIFSGLASAKLCSHLTHLSSFRIVFLEVVLVIRSSYLVRHCGRASAVTVTGRT